MKTSKRLKLKMKHAELVKAGKYEIAWKLFGLLKRGAITLGSGNEASCEADKILEKMGVPFKVNRRWGTVTYSL
ncbi:hypothetical protein OCV58_08415 [Megasphaera butyrica]|uniref:hypothetical protein n=1 Tax=Megasphaera butyrica TaxID=2981791 RepID=UPI000821DC7C|nr:hypothetical protein [Megasphaera butyrica]MCU6714931.1 hypothetical protein [Megasphaera butyrica]SCH84377.1 Uncharacterised protein [uncultured Megasphaera sp.]SCJ42845.1 Uncharacterised protein [uncultured Ruminococcus sp.]